MYAVIMAGGGGTRLHPLSRPERPKPFLPLLGDRTLLQSTAARLPTDDITVVTDRRYERLVRDQLPDAAVLIEPMGRNTAAAIALATVAIDRPDGRGDARRPGRRPHRPGTRRRLPRRPPRRPERTWPPARSTSTSRSSRSAPRSTRPATEYGYLIPRPRARRGRSTACRPTRCAAFEEKPKPARAEELRERGGRRLERRHLPVAAAGDPRRARAVHRARPAARADDRRAGTSSQHAYEQLKPVSIDYAVMESAARNGQVVMASMDVGWSDLGSWTALLEAIGARGSGAVVQAGRDGRGRGGRPGRAPRGRPAGRRRAHSSAVA